MHLPRDADRDRVMAIYNPDVTRRLMEKVVRGFKLCEADAFEIVSIAQSKAYRKWERYNPKRLDIFAWLWVITNRVAIDWLRKHKGITICSIDTIEDLTTSLHPTSEDPAEIYRQKVRKERLWRLLNQLPMMERYVLILHYMDGYSYKKVAQRFHITQRQVRYLQAKGLARIRQRYGLKEVRRNKVETKRVKLSRAA